MIKVNLSGCNMAAVQRMAEETVLNCSAPEKIEFCVEYVSTARILAKYGILHGYKVSARQTGHYQIYVTYEVDWVRTHTLVDEVLSEINKNQAFNPEYIFI